MDICCCITGSKADSTISEGILYNIFENIYAPFLMLKKVRVAVVIIFFGFLCLNLAVIPKIDIGLDQELSMPDDSYVFKYFQVNIIDIIVFTLTFID